MGPTVTRTVGLMDRRTDGRTNSSLNEWIVTSSYKDAQSYLKCKRERKYSIVLNSLFRWKKAAIFGKWQKKAKKVKIMKSVT